MRDYVTVNIKSNGAKNAKSDAEKQFKKGITLLELSGYHLGKYPALAAKVNNELCELREAVTSDCEIEFLDITDINGFRIYQRGVVFLLVCAAKEILGKNTRVIVEHSINRNYFFNILHNDKNVTDELLEKIEERMRELAAQDINIQKQAYPVEEAIRICNEMGLSDKVGNLKYRRTSNVNLYNMGWFYDYFYGRMVASTGCLTFFGLSRQADGYLLKFPLIKNPEVLAENVVYEKLEQVFAETSAWAKILKADTLNALHRIICDGGISEFIRINEALHEKKLALIADNILSAQKSFVAISGPSSSGKTTFARRLSVQLRVNGLRPHIISLDNYFVDREKSPRDENGDYDFESVGALDLETMNKHFEDLLSGKTVELPTYNFVSGKREYKGNFLRLTPQDVLIIEGIHGLNEKVNGCIPGNKLYKIFISALTQLNIDDHNRIATTDTRIIRRIVRDSRTRNVDCSGTIAMWPSVTRGEEKNIFPFQDHADIMFNSSLVYEMCVLKQYAEPLLFNIDKSKPQYTEARRLIKILDSFLGVSSEDVPKNSILREFIGGSCFHDV